MSFIADKQTLDDLNIHGKYKPGSIFNIFNRCQTAGGEKLLASLFQTPLISHDQINKRSSIFSFFQNTGLDFPIDRKQFDIMENYLQGVANRNFITAGASLLKKCVLGSLIKDQRYSALKEGLQTTLTIINACNDFIKTILAYQDNPCESEIKLIGAICNDKRLNWAADDIKVKQLPFIKLLKYDYLLRHTLQKEITTVLEFIYDLDVYIAVGSVAREKNFSYAKALSQKNNLFNAEELRHPALDEGVGNTIAFTAERNLLFLTGANMAGKSTLMKACGIALYLAHMGFPVAAKKIEFSVKEGIYSTINVSDNLKMGYSHFYAEVLRVKNVAEVVSNLNNLFVIFDELFKGTNVKDAYDATFSVVSAFSTYQNCFFIISTHIIEVGDALHKPGNNIQFSYLPTVMHDNTPSYTYRLKEGITADRHGMIIIENEGILEMLDFDNKAQQ